MGNEDIRREAQAAGVKLWQIADGLGINDGNFSRKLRHMLSAADKARIMEIIKMLEAERDRLIVEDQKHE
jgi:hypothetical protein